MIDLRPDILLGAVPPIPEHAILALAAGALGAWQLAAPKGTARHRVVGWTFVLAMGFVALSALFISTIRTWGYFSPIHLLVPVTLFALYRAVTAARRGDIRAHAAGMVSLFVLAIVVTGAFTFYPGRIMNQTIFGPSTAAGRAVNALEVEGLGKSFVMHLQGGIELPVVRHVAFTVAAGECVVLGGPSGAGKSSVLKMVAGTYGASEGAIRVRHRGALLDITRLLAREMIAVRRETIANVTQFLRAIPRVGALDLVAAAGDGDTDAAAALLTRLNLPERLWGLPPATFSGGEKQRVNIAAGFIRETPLLLVDEPTASLDAHNRGVVMDMIEEKLATGTAVLGIFHDETVRERVADRIVDGDAVRGEGSGMKLSETPLIDPTASVADATLGKYTEVAARTSIRSAALGDYSYIMADGDILHSTVGKFCSLASNVRLNPPNHPIHRASQHHFTYRAADYFADAEHDDTIFEWRRARWVTIGHDVWIGHGATVMPGVSVGTGAVIGAGSVVTKDVAPYTIVAGVPARVIRPRFEPEIAARLQALAWWDWPHDRLRRALPDFQTLPVADFLDKHERG